jgi:hypothetical protein
LNPPKGYNYLLAPSVHLPPSVYPSSLLIKFKRNIQIVLHILRVATRTYSLFNTFCRSRLGRATSALQHNLNSKSIHPSIHQSIYPAGRPSIRPSKCLSIRTSTSTQNSSHVQGVPVQHIWNDKLPDGRHPQPPLLHSKSNFCVCQCAEWGLRHTAVNVWSF